MTVSAPTTSADTRWPALYTLCAGIPMIILDATIVNVALPSIQDDFGFSQSSLAWVVNAYLIPFGGRASRPADAAAPVPLAESHRRQHHDGAERARMFATLSLGALYLQRVLGYDPLEVGWPSCPSPS